MAKHHVVVYLEDEEYQALEAERLRTGQSRSSVLRGWVMQRFAQAANGTELPAAAPVAAASTPAGRTLAQVLADLLGMGGDKGALLTV